MIKALFELGVDPQRLAKMSGIGCSSKTPAYFVDRAHGMNAVHGRMPATTTGAHLGNRDLIMIGVSGDGDTPPSASVSSCTWSAATSTART